MLAQGPPGTGKTHAIVAMVTALLLHSPAAATTAPGNQPGTKQRRVLVCAQSNAAVDELVVRLAKQVPASPLLTNIPSERIVVVGTAQ